jgi:hypothetical protein
VAVHELTGQRREKSQPIVKSTILQAHRTASSPTAREREILVMIAGGSSNAEIVEAFVESKAAGRGRVSRHSPVRYGHVPIACETS